MKTKTLALVNGIIGLAGGIFLIISPFILLSSVASDLGSSVLQNSTTVTSTTMSSTLVLIVTIAILVLGIVGAVQYRGDVRVGSAPSVLLIVGGGVALVPFLGWAGGIVAVVGGSLYLAKLKNFKDETVK